MKTARELLVSKRFEFKSDGTLFGIDPLIAVVKHLCPYCGNKLKKMKKRELVYCTSLKHKRFIMDAKKLK